MYTYLPIKRHQRWAIRLVKDPALTGTLNSLIHRRTVSALSLFVELLSWHLFWQDKINNPRKKIHLREIHDFLRFNIPTRFNWILTEQTHSPIYLSLWLLETRTHFPCRSSQLNIITFSPSRPASTDTFNSDPIPEIFSFFHDTRVDCGLQRLYLFGATS